MNAGVGNVHVCVEIDLKREMLGLEGRVPLLARIIRIIGVIVMSFIILSSLWLYLNWDLLIKEIALAGRSERKAKSEHSSVNAETLSRLDHKRSKVDDKSQKRMNQEVSKMLWDACATANVDYVSALLSHPNIDVNYQNGGSGTPLFVIASSEENKATLRVLDMLLKHPNINPNSDRMTWPPLKMALHKGNRRMVERFLEHPAIDSQVAVGGLSCDSLAIAPNGIWFVVEPTSLECFRVHKNALSHNDPRVGQHRVETTLDSIDKKKVDGGSKKTASQSKITEAVNNVRRVRSGEATQSESLLGEAGSLVLNPTLFSNVFEATIFYFLGNTGAVWPWIFVICVLFFSSVVSSVVYIANAVEAENKREAEVRAEE